VPSAPSAGNRGADRGFDAAARVHACACRDSSFMEVAASPPVKISGYQVSPIRIIDPLLRGILPSSPPVSPGVPRHALGELLSRGCSPLAARQTTNFCGRSDKRGRGGEKEEDS